MEQETQEKRWSGNPFSILTDKLNIRGKLMLAFAVIILLTIAAIGGATIYSQQAANKTIDELVNVYGKISRMSLQAEEDIRIMSLYEKDFLLNYNRIGTIEAKEQYLNPFIATGGVIYQALYEIQQLAPDDDSKVTAQRAIDTVNNYMSAFIGTVNTLERQFDQESGEATKLQETIDELRDSMSTVNTLSLQTRFQDLLYNTQEYMITPDPQGGEFVLSEARSFRGEVESSKETPALRAALMAQVDEFSRWFADIVATNDTTTARILAYQEAVDQAQDASESLREKVGLEEMEAVARTQAAEAFVQNIVIAVGISSLVLGLLIFFLVARGLTRQVNLIMNLLGELGIGNFQARSEVVSTDELGRMAEALNGMLDSITALIQSQEERDAIQDSIMNLMEDISALTEGDLTARAKVTEDLTGAIADSFNTMAEQFGNIVRQVQSATFSVDATATDASRRTSDLAVKSTDQVQQVNATIQALNSMADSIRQVSQHAARSAEVSETSRSNAREGAEAVDQTNRAMDEIREQINETARSIKRLGESSMEIGNVVEIINNIADRTSILALNASIQAAMAGDAGYGFAVVAEEVQRLSESSSNSTKQIDMLVKSIQSEIRDASNRMDESISKVVQGSHLADDAHEKLQQIETVSNQLADLIEAITQAADEQVRMSEDLVKNMVAVGDVSDETSKTSQETASMMNLLNSTASKLREAVEAFKIENARTAA